MMRCETVKELLEVYVEGELDEPIRKDIETHIASCELCRQELTLTQSIPRLVGSLQTPPIPADIIPKVLERTARWRWAGSFGIFLLKRWYLVASASVLIALILFGISYLKPGEKPGMPNEVVKENRPEIVKVEPDKKSDVTKVVPTEKRDGHVYKADMNKKRIPSEEEIALTEEEIKFALGIASAATQNVWFGALTEGMRALDIAKSESEDAMRTLSTTQLEVFECITDSLALLNKGLVPIINVLQLEEVE